MTGPDRYDLAWAMIGALAFLDLLQGYELLAEVQVAVRVKAGFATAVSVASAVTTRWFARLLLARNGSA